MGGIYPRTNAILKELGRYDELVKWDARTQVIDADGTRYTVRFDQVMSFLGMSALSLRDKLRIAVGVGAKFLSPGPALCFDGAELARYDSGESLETWSRRVLGDRGTNYITVPYMGFLYAVPMSWLSPALFHAVLKQFHKLSLSVPPKGMGQICDWLVEGSPGLDLHLSSSADQITRTDGGGYTVHSGGETHDVDAVIVAPEPGVAADLLHDLIPEASTRKLRDCLYSQYAHVQVCYRTNPWPDFPASVALPANTESDWGACVLLSKRQPQAVPEGGEAVGVYFYTPPLADMTDEDIIASALEAVREVYGPAPEPSFVQLFHYGRGLSIANPGHYGTLDSLHAEMPDGIYLAGDYFSHAGVEAAIFSGELAANRLTGSRPSTTHATQPTARPHR
jgi:oxygen-dependent protoporphyrinogen oxidase